MFEFQDGMHDLPFPPHSLVRILRGMNLVRISVGEFASEPAEAYAVTGKEGGQFRTFVVFYLEKPKVRLIYSADENPFGGGRKEDVETQALEFLEQMGTIVEDVGWENLTPGLREDWIAREFLYPEEAGGHPLPAEAIAQSPPEWALPGVDAVIENPEIVPAGEDTEPYPAPPAAPVPLVPKPQAWSPPHPSPDKPPSPGKKGQDGVNLEERFDDFFAKAFPGKFKKAAPIPGTGRAAPREPEVPLRTESADEPSLPEIQAGEESPPGARPAAEADSAPAIPVAVPPKEEGKPVIPVPSSSDKALRQSVIRFLAGW